MENNALYELCTIQFTYVLQNVTESLLPAATGIQHKAILRICGACLRARTLIHLHSKM